MKKRSVFLLFALAGVIVVACRSSGDTKEDTKPTTAAAAPADAGPPALPPPPGVDVAIMDTAADPCSDFYRYACGGWMDKTEIPADRAAWSRGFMTILERNEKILRDILEKTAAGQAPEGTPVAQKLGDYWASCMEDSLVEAGKDPLLADIKKLNAVKDAKSVTNAVAMLHGRGIWPFFRFGSTQDFKNSEMVIAEVDQAGLGLPDRDYYLKTDEKTAKIREQYVEHVQKMFELAGQAPDVAAKNAKAVMELETKLAEASLTNVERRDPDKLYHPTKVPELKKLASSFVWDAYLKAQSVKPASHLNVTHTPFVQKVGELVKGTKPDVMRAYLTWHLLNGAARVLPKAFVEEDFRFKSLAFTGTKEDLPRWKKCVSFTDEALGHALAVPFVTQTFGEEGKTTTQQMVVNVEQAFEKNLGTLAWMDEPTKQKALEKVKAIINKIGYPDEWRKYDTLEVARGPFFTNAVNAANFEVKRDLAKIGKPVDKNEWYMTPPTVNAYYNPLVNEIVFPAGILQPPFFNRDATAAVNYGAMGMVVGHEITHGFDDQGRKFDAKGNLNDWWTADSATKFTERTQCVKNQFDGYTAIDDLKINGALTLGENVADLGGLKLAYMAMSETVQDTTAYQFNKAQQFFLGYAQSWCSKYRDAHARLRAQTDPHSPPYWRVNGPLRNLPQFAEAFGCKEGQPMVRPAAERCEVW